VPYTFAYDTTLLLQGGLVNIALGVGTAVIGVFAVGVGVAGYIKCTMNLAWRVVVIAAGIMMVIPSNMLSFTGLVVFAVVYVINHLQMKKLNTAGI
jgi:TRAP-type uncharacterized transport system fused permease subunit